jgi:hypothetical protein
VYLWFRAYSRVSSCATRRKCHPTGVIGGRKDRELRKSLTARRQVGANANGCMDPAPDPQRPTLFSSLRPIGEWPDRRSSVSSLLGQLLSRDGFTPPTPAQHSCSHVGPQADYDPSATVDKISPEEVPIAGDGNSICRPFDNFCQGAVLSSTG